MIQWRLEGWCQGEGKLSVFMYHWDTDRMWWSANAMREEAMTSMYKQYKVYLVLVLGHLITLYAMHLYTIRMDTMCAECICTFIDVYSMGVDGWMDCGYHNAMPI